MGRGILITKLLCTEDDLYSIFLSLHTADGIVSADSTFASTALCYIGIRIQTVTQGLTRGIYSEALSIFRSGNRFYAVKAFLYVFYVFIFSYDTDNRLGTEGYCGNAVSVSVDVYKLSVPC